jgi:hypothetical protein
MIGDVRESPKRGSSRLGWKQSVKTGSILEEITGNAPAQVRRTGAASITKREEEKNWRPRLELHRCILSRALCYDPFCFADRPSQDFTYRVFHFWVLIVKIRGLRLDLRPTDQEIWALAVQHLQNLTNSIRNKSVDVTRILLQIRTGPDYDLTWSYDGLDWDFFFILNRFNSVHRNL